MFKRVLLKHCFDFEEIKASLLIGFFSTLLKLHKRMQGKRCRKQNRVVRSLRFMYVQA